MFITLLMLSAMTNRNKYFQIGLTVVLCIVLILLSVRGYIKDKELNEYKAKISELKHNLILKDETIRIDSTKYSKVVNDLYSERELLNKVKKSNETLYGEVKNYKLLYYGAIKTDTTKAQGKPVEVSSVGSTTITDFFPAEGDPFIKYKYINKDGKKESTFTLYPIQLSYIIRENTIGIKEVVFETPEFLKVDNIQLDMVSQTTPINTNKSKFGLYVGAGGMVDKDKVSVLGRVGVQTGKMLYDVQANKNTVIVSASFKLF